MSFKENHFEVIRNALSLDLLHYVNTNCEILESINYFIKPSTKENPYPKNDSLVANSFSWYSACHTESLLVHLKYRIENITGKKLHECYSYYRNYYHNAILPKHIDRESAEFSVTICINKDTDWPIFIEDNAGVAHEIELNPGDMIVYRGDVLRHWRNTYSGETHRQIFLHYVEAGGKHDNFKFDERPMLGVANNSRRTI
jgi:hypothetical protein